MNSRSEAPIWQTWSEKWGSWNSWFQPRVRRDIREESIRNAQRWDLDADQVDYSTREVQHETRATEPG